MRLKLPRPGRPSLRALLAMLGLVIAVPALAFSAYLISRTAEQQHIDHMARLEVSARAISAAVDRHVVATLSTLKVLASSPLLDDDDLDAFQQRTKAAMADTGIRVTLLDRGLKPLVDTQATFAPSLSDPSRSETARRVIGTGKDAVFDLIRGRGTQAGTVGVLTPVMRDGAVRYVLMATQSASVLAAILSEQPLDAGWAVVLEDGNGETIGWSSRVPASAPGVRPAGDAAPSTGDPAMVGYSHRSDVTGWSVTARVPAALMDQDVNRSWRLLLWGALGLVLLSVGLALWFARVMSQPILHLVHQARALGDGQVMDPVRSPIGEVNAVSKAMTQAARERVDAEARARLLMREMAHRAKNQLALVNAIARQTAKHARTIEEFQQRFGRRIDGMARSTDLFVSGRHDGISLADLISTHLNVFDSPGLPRVRMSGPPVALSTDVVEKLGLALHELATNASKYGALSVPEGHVSVRWNLTGTSPRRLLIHWSEENGPAVSAPKRKGFGSQLIKNVTAQMLEAQASLEFARTGLRWSLDMPYRDPNDDDDDGDSDGDKEDGGA